MKKLKSWFGDSSSEDNSSSESSENEASENEEEWEAINRKKGIKSKRIIRKKK